MRCITSFQDYLQRKEHATVHLHVRNISLFSFAYSSEKPAKPNAAGPPWVVITPAAGIHSNF